MALCSHCSWRVAVSSGLCKSCDVPDIRLAIADRHRERRNRVGAIGFRLIPPIEGNEQFIRKPMPPMPISNDELDRSVNERFTLHAPIQELQTSELARLRQLTATSAILKERLFRKCQDEYCTSLAQWAFDHPEEVRKIIDAVPHSPFIPVECTTVHEGLSLKGERNVPS